MNYYVSDVALRNNKENGYWIIIDNLVYDVSHFVDYHPGGNIILMNNSGRDATGDFMKVQHHENLRIIRSLKKFYIGELYQVKFDQKVFQDLYEKWLKNNFLIIEMQNTFYSDLSFINKANTYNESFLELTPHKIDLLLETHNRFVNDYLNLIIQKINDLKLYLTKEYNVELKGIVIHVSMVNNIIVRIRKNNATIGEVNVRDQLSWHNKMLVYRKLIERNNTKLLSDIKHEMLNGLKLFESGNIEKSYVQLASSLNSIETVITKYLEKIKIETQAIGFPLEELQTI